MENGGVWPCAQPSSDCATFTGLRHAQPWEAVCIPLPDAASVVCGWSAAANSGFPLMIRTTMPLPAGPFRRGQSAVCGPPSPKES